MIQTGAVLLKQRCNIYGGENDGGAKRVLGGLDERSPARQWYCKEISIGRFRMHCEHGHVGQEMPLCLSHFLQYKDAVSFCPRCNIPPSDHRCKLELREVS